MPTPPKAREDQVSALESDIAELKQRLTLSYAPKDIPEPVTPRDQYLRALLVELRAIRALLKQKP